jgi:hypothetical protein
MASTFETIASAVRTVVAAVSGAPATVEVRDTDVVHPEEMPIVVITMGDENPFRSVSGAGTSTDQGDEIVTYEIGVSIYKENQAANATVGDRQDFVEACQKVLHNNTLAGAPSVFKAEMVRRAAWEHRPFRDGVEKSVFGVVFYSSETKLGN